MAKNKNLVYRTSAKKGNPKSKVGKSGDWKAGTMGGEWKGIGTWYEDGKWKGQGRWQGGGLSGIWKGNGKWKSVTKNSGEWEGKGELTSNMSLPSPEGMLLITAIGVLANILNVILGLVINSLGWSTLIISIVALGALLLVAGSYLNNSTCKGSWKATGTWYDKGEFRILILEGPWKLGAIEGTLSGDMEDTKPS